MKTPRFFCDRPLSPHQPFELSKAVSVHVARVLRLRAGELLTLFDGQGGQYEATIISIQKEKVSVSVGEWADVERESPLQLVLAQAIQSADKMDYTVQKATELGVHAILPLLSRRSLLKLSGERQEKRQRHWQAVAVSACEQCGRNRVPAVFPIQEMSLWLSRLAPEISGLKLFLSPTAKGSFCQLSPKGDTTLLIGAEGGLDEKEEAAACQSGFIPVCLGPRILRTETASLAALSALQALWGDFKGE